VEVGWREVGVPWTIDRVRQPPSSWTVRRSTPAMTSREANVWRHPCHVKPSSRVGHPHCRRPALTRIDELVRQDPERAYEADFFQNVVKEMGWRLGS
jgi:hypothetical protein